MERTTNLNLPQWEANDPIRRGDFNEAFAALDASGYVIGTYTGNGLTMDEGGLTVELGFQPRFLIISCGWSTAANPNRYYMLVGERRSISSDILTFTDIGFAVAVAVVTGSVDNYVRMNEKNTVYSYIAFR